MTTVLLAVIAVATSVMALETVVFALARLARWRSERRQTLALAVRLRVEQERRAALVDERPPWE